jgi:hypothetical protein
MVGRGREAPPPVKSPQIQERPISSPAKDVDVRGAEGKLSRGNNIPVINSNEKRRLSWLKAPFCLLSEFPYN